MPGTEEAETLPLRRELAAETDSGGPPREDRRSCASSAMEVEDGRSVVSRQKRKASE